MIHIGLNFVQGTEKAMGISTYLNNLITHLIPYAQKHGYHFHLFTINPPISSLPKKHFTYHIISIPEGVKNHKAVQYYKKKLVEAVISHIPKIEIFFFQNFELTGSIKKLYKNNIHVLTNIHDLIEVYLFTPKFLFKRKRDYNIFLLQCIKQLVFLRFQSKYLSGILTVSKTSQKQILKILPSNSPLRLKLNVTPLGVEALFKPYGENTFKKLLKILDKKRYDPSIELSSIKKPFIKKQKLSLPYKKFILYFSGQHIQKNVLFAMRGCIQAVKTYPQLKDFKIVIIANSHRWTPKLVKENLHKDLVFLRGLEKDQLAVLVSAARFTIHSSLMEGFGLPALESIRTHTLPICSNIDARQEILGKDYPMFNPFNLSSLIKLIGYFSALSPEEETALKNKVLKQCQKYSWQETARLTHQVFKKLLT